MNSRTPPTPVDRERLREQWLQQAAAVFDLYYDADAGTPPVTFSQREQRACTLTRELAAFLLEQDLGHDPAARLTDASPPACPAVASPHNGVAMPANPSRGGS